MKNRLSRAGTILLALAVVSCWTGPGGPEELGADSSKPAEVPLPLCTYDIGPCRETSDEILLKMLLEAADFGADARLVAMGGEAVLVAPGDGTLSIVRLNRYGGPDPGQPYYSYELPTTGVRPIAIAEASASGTEGGPLMMLAVVTCDAAGERCSMWSSVVDREYMRYWQETELPSGLLPRGVAFDSGVEPQEPCVYGNGLFCLDDTWQEEIALSSDLQINDVAFGAQRSLVVDEHGRLVFGARWSLAVGEHGRWFKRESDDSGVLQAWQEQPRLGEASLTQASVTEGGGVIIGEGRLQAAVGAQAADFNCNPPDGLVALMLAPFPGGWNYGVTSTGEVFRHASVVPQLPGPYCALQQLELPGAVLETTIVTCGISTNPRVLTERALLGADRCAVED